LLFTRFAAFDTSNTPSGEAEAEYRPDVTIYEKEGGMSTQKIMAFQMMEMFVEFKHGSSTDPFATEENSSRSFSTTLATSWPNNPVFDSAAGLSIPDINILRRDLR